MTQLIPMDTVAHNGVDFAPIRWKYDDYFRRDGRHIGSCNWFAAASSWCLDLWRPLDDLTPEEAVSNITLAVPERGVMKPDHLVSDYALSRNIARFGLKFKSLREVWLQYGMSDASFFYHKYTMSLEEKITRIRQMITRWGI